MRKLRVAVALALCGVLSFPGTGIAYTKNLSVPPATQELQHYCVPASVQMMMRYQGRTPHTQTWLYNTGRDHIRCSGEAAGLDPLAWAWLLYLETGQSRSYDDYLYTSAYWGTRALIEQLYYYSEPSGALVNEGHHAMVVRGATTSCNPSELACDNSNYTISAVFVNDPYYLYGGYEHTQGGTTCGSSHYPCGFIGLRTNTAITYSNWTRYYYTKWAHQDCAYYDGYYVSVLRRSSGAPTVVSGGDATASAPTFDAELGRSADGATPAGPVLIAESTAPEDLEATLAAAVTLYGLDKQPEFRDDLRLARVSEVVRVKSLTPKFPDYILASVAGPRGIRAVAMFTLGGDGPEFAAVNVTEVNLQHVTRFTAADAQSRFGGTTQGTPELVWAWSTASQSPFAPLWRVSRNESSVFLLNDGTTATELQLE